MWVVLVVGILNKEHDRGRTHSLRQRIQEIPFELDALFRDISTRDNHDTRGLLLCIQWVLFARQPLSPLELYLAILAETEPELLKDWHLSPFAQSIESATKFILDVSKGLIEVVQDEQPTVQFIHESVREFILQGDGLGEILQGQKDRFAGLSHSALARSCLNYIEISLSIRRGREAGGQRAIPVNELRDTLITTWPFLRYATEHILYHAGAAQVGGVSQSQLLHEFRLRDWVSHHHLLLGPDGNGNATSPQLSQNRLKRSYLYVLVHNNKLALFRLFAANRSCLDTGEWLHRASILEAIATNDSSRLQKHIEMLKETGTPDLSRTVLPENGGNGRPSTPDTEGHPHAWETRLLYSALNQDDDLLLAFSLTGTNLQDYGKDEYGRTPMTVARSEAAVRVLINYGADINAAEDNGRIILTHFVLRNDYPIVELLIKRGADVDKRDGRGDTALCAAASDGARPLAFLLIKNGADIESRGESGLTPLAWAARSGNAGVAALLLDEGARTNSFDNERRTPLMWATQNQHAAVLAMLLKKEADPNPADEKGRTPLSWAAEYGNCHIIYILLENGAPTDHADLEGRTPLYWALKHGKQEALGLMQGWKAARTPQDRFRLLRYMPGQVLGGLSRLRAQTLAPRKTTDPTDLTARRNISGPVNRSCRGGSRSGYN